MKKLLLIIPLLIWVACEDEDNESDNLEDDFQFVNEWVECKKISTTEFSEDGQVLNENIINWNGNICTYSTGAIEHYNEYGLPTKFIPSDSSYIYNRNYIDKWKLISEYGIDENGDTNNVIDFEWNGLTCTWTDNNNNDDLTYNYTEVYNEFGKLLSREMISNLGEYSYSEIEYMEDQRRELILKTTYTIGGELETQIEWIWNGNQCTLIYNQETYGDLQIEITVNEYFEIINQTIYAGGNFLDLSSHEYECPGFEQIYP